MRWLNSEYLLKGAFLGLLLGVALTAPSWRAAGEVALWTLGGLVVALAIAVGRRLAQGVRPAGRWVALLTLVVLESPTTIYSGLLLGLTAGALAVSGWEPGTHLLIAVAGGAVFVGGLAALRQIGQPWRRLLLAGLIAGLAVAVAIEWIENDLADQVAHRQALGAFLLLGMPFFYLLVLAGREEETEVEIAALCGGLALGIWLLRFPGPLPAAGLIIPAAIYVLYATKVLPGLRVFKHTLRGLGHFQLGRLRPALASFRRALQLDPKNALARRGLERLHRGLDLERVAREPETLALLDYDLCLAWAESHLLGDQAPTEPQRAEASRLLDLVASQRPDQAARVAYDRAVLATHTAHFDEAEVQLVHLLGPSAWAADDPVRRAWLFPGWQLALDLHPELERRVGGPQLLQPGRRREAIAAVERRLAEQPDDETAWGLKRRLYSELTEADLTSPEAADPLMEPLTDADAAYLQQLGLTLIDRPERWRRGAEYLRLASRGLPEQRPGIFQKLAVAHDQAEEPIVAEGYRRRARQEGLRIGVANLAEDQRAAFFIAVRQLADLDAARGEIDAAIEGYQLYSTWPRGGPLETLRTLSGLHERRGDPLAALRSVERALVYNNRDPDLLERQDRYYYSVLPEQVKGLPDEVRREIDLAYCLRRSRQLLELPTDDLEYAAWARHLAELALVLRPDSLTAQVTLARTLLRQGERDEALRILEDTRCNKPERFADSDDQEAWFLSCRLLGDLYLNEFDRPDLAAASYLDFRQSSRSGADTLYKLGVAHERMGDPDKAVQFYREVMVYDSHPLTPEAREAIRRLRTT